MTKSRFLQIGLMLHFNDNEDEEGREKDSLHKIRPLLNILKLTLGKYAIFESELSLDEATMANKSSYARFLICFNPMKPTGKFHFRIYRKHLIYFKYISGAQLFGKKIQYFKQIKENYTLFK